MTNIKGMDMFLPVGACLVCFACVSVSSPCLPSQLVAVGGNLRLSLVGAFPLTSPQSPICTPVRHKTNLLPCKRLKSSPCWIIELYVGCLIITCLKLVILLALYDYQAHLQCNSLSSDFPPLPASSLCQEFPWISLPSISPSHQPANLPVHSFKSHCGLKTPASSHFFSLTYLFYNKLL